MVGNSDFKENPKSDLDLNLWFVKDKRNKVTFYQKTDQIQTRVSENTDQNLKML